MKEAKYRYICRECGLICFDDQLLSAPNPFDDTDNITGCPECKSVDSFTAACMDRNCCNESTGGHPKVFGYRYLWLCYKHSPRNENGAIPNIIEAPQ